MNSVYPMEEKQHHPPTYEQAIYHTPGLPSSNPAFPSSSPYSNPAAGIHAPIPPPGPYAPPPGGVYQSPPVATQYVITTQSLIYGDVPLQCQCPNCHQVIVTRIEKRSGLVSWLACGGILLFGCWLGCCLIPFCVDSFKDTEHYCPNCANLLGTRRRM